MWRLHERDLFSRSHAVIRLPVHLQYEQNIYFEPGLEAEANIGKDTKLTAFFKLCTESEDARQYLYHQIPEHYVWTNNAWKIRKRNAKSLGRMFTVNPADRERFFLRMLLLHVKGPMNFRHLKTVDGTECASYAEAAEKMQLTDTDEEWTRCLQEAATFRLPSQLRDLFATLCIFCSPTNIPLLWNTFKDAFIEDFAREYDANASTNRALQHLQHIFMLHGRTCEDFGLPTPAQIVHTEQIYDAEEEQRQGQQAYEKLNVEQRQIADDVLGAIRRNAQQSYFVDGPGGSGKTFLYETLCHILRGERKTVLTVAWTGIAAQLLPGGRTAHSVFKLPVPVLDTSVSSIRQNSSQADQIRQSSLIIWDEISMVPKQALQIVDRLLRDIMGCSRPFGGKIILFGGDFRQVLPVVRHGTATDIVETNVKKATVWNTLETRRLTTNMRANSDPEFACWLLQMGDGDLFTHQQISNDAVQIPKKHFCQEQDFIEKVFDTNEINERNVQLFYRTAVLCPKNEHCDKINNFVVNNIVQGEVQTYLSCDSVQPQEDGQQLILPSFSTLSLHQGYHHTLCS